MYEDLKKKVIDYGKKLDRYGLIALSGGNISCRLENDLFLVTPSGMIYEELEPSDICVVDKDGEVVEGKRKPSVDTKALLYVYNHLPDVNAVFHTHQPYATALGLVSDRIDCDLTTLANTAKGHVNVAPYASAASIDMGIAAVDYLDGKLAVVLKNHGVLTVGKDLKEAFYAAVYLEEAAKTLSVAKSLQSNIAKLTEDQIANAVEIFNHYGQK